MSQVATKKRLHIRNERVRVIGRFHEQGSVLAGTAEGFCDGFDVEVSIESEEGEAVIAELVRVARQMCFTEKALAGSVAVQVKPLLNGRPLAGSAAEEA